MRMTVDEALQVSDEQDPMAAAFRGGAAFKCLAAEVRRLRDNAEPTDKMINAGLLWLHSWQHMRMSDKRSNLAEAFKSMCRIRNDEEGGVGAMNARKK